MTGLSKDSKFHFGSRRFVIACLGIISCVFLGVYLQDITASHSIAFIVASIAGAGAVGDIKKKD